MQYLGMGFQVVTTPIIMLCINVLPLHVNPSPLYPESHVQM